VIGFVLFVLSRLGKLNYMLVHTRQPGMQALSFAEQEMLMQEYRTIIDSPRSLAPRLRMHNATTTGGFVVRSRQKMGSHRMPPAAIKRRHVQANHS
jgi:hypothetical protein